MTPAVTAWREMLAYQSEVIFRIERDLKDARAIPLAAYDILIELETSAEKRLRLFDLAQACILTKSGISKIVNTLEKQGLLARERCPSDRRGYFAVITAKGSTAVRRAWIIYQKCIKNYFENTLSAKEIEQLNRILPKLRQSLPVNFMEKACSE
jgi:DNA-binding MarR family transcriptional regulator